MAFNATSSSIRRHLGGTQFGIINVVTTIYLQRVPAGDWLGLFPAQVSDLAGRGYARAEIFDRGGWLGTVLQASLRQHGRQLYLRTIVALAFVGGLHEGVDLQCLLGTDRRRAGLEKLDNLDHQRPVGVVRADGAFALVALGLPSVAASFAEHAHTVAVPLASHDDLPVLGAANN